jgi:hypothetical protein
MVYTAFLAALTFAHRARCAAAIFLRAAADKVRFTGAEAVVFADGAAAGCVPFLAFNHRAFCAKAIFRREAAETTRTGWLALGDGTDPFNDSMTEIA